MSRACFVPVLVAALCVSACAAHASNPYADFRIPSHHWSAASGDYHFDFAHSRVETPGEQSRSGTLHSAIVTSGTWASESDRWLREVDAGLNADGLRSYGEDVREDAFGLTTREERTRFLSATTSVGLLVRSYPWDVPLGFTLHGQALWGPDREWLASDESFAQGPDVERQHANVLRRNSVEVVQYSAGFGMGRVRDATPVYQAQRLEEELLERGVLSEPLRFRTRAALAAWFALQPAVVFAHERPDRYFWDEVERLLREDGALRGGTLGALASFRLAEAGITSALPLRRTGFFVGPEISAYDVWLAGAESEHDSAEELTGGAVVRAFDLRFGLNVSSHTRSFALVGATAEYHRPMGERWQFDAQSLAQYSASHHLLIANTFVQEEWMIADRWFASANVSHSSRALEQPHTGRIVDWQIGYNGTLHYLLEDRWSLSLGFDGNERHDASGDRQLQRLQIGVSRWFTGILSAPGVILPLRRSGEVF